MFGMDSPSDKDVKMLVLSRKVLESIVIDNRITITVIGIRGGVVRLGIKADKDVPVHRQEVQAAIQSENGSHGSTG